MCRTTRRSPFFPSGTAVTTNRCSVDAREFVQLFFDFDVRHHFAADFAEAAQAVRDREEAVFIFCRDVAGDVPAIAQNFRRFLGLAEIALHHVGPAHEQQSRRAGRQPAREYPDRRCAR